jgi:hypothetical protein
MKGGFIKMNFIAGITFKLQSETLKHFILSAFRA